MFSPNWIFTMLLLGTLLGYIVVNHRKRKNQFWLDASFPETIIQNWMMDSQLHEIHMKQVAQSTTWVRLTCLAILVFLVALGLVWAKCSKVF